MLRLHTSEWQRRLERDRGCTTGWPSISATNRSSSCPTASRSNTTGAATMARYGPAIVRRPRDGIGAARRQLLGRLGGARCRHRRSAGRRRARLAWTFHPRALAIAFGASGSTSSRSEAITTDSRTKACGRCVIGRSRPTDVPIGRLQDVSLRECAIRRRGLRGSRNRPPARPGAGLPLRARATDDSGTASRSPRSWRSGTFPGRGLRISRSARGDVELLNGLLGSIAGRVSDADDRAQLHRNGSTLAPGARLTAREDAITYDGRHTGSRRTQCRSSGRADWRPSRLLSRPAERQSAASSELPDNVRVILGVDRLDYTKGIDEKLLAVEHLLDSHPELRGAVRVRPDRRTDSRVRCRIPRPASRVRATATRINRPLRPGALPSRRPARIAPRA